jgi:hypothetical protein
MLLSDSESTQSFSFENPFAEAETRAGERDPVALAEAYSPFAGEDRIGSEVTASEAMLAEVLAELRDEHFDEALAALAEETESAVTDRFVGEGPSYEVERERFADLQLATVRYEAERFLGSLESGLQGLDLASFSDEQLEEKLDQFAPETGELTVAGEEFIGGLVRKARAAVKTVVSVAKKAGALVSPLLAPVLKKIKALIKPLLKRVLALAIGRLPAPLRPAARQLAQRFQLEGEGEAVGSGETVMSPANLSDSESLAQDFDEALAEAFVGERDEAWSGELEWAGEDEWSEGESAADGRQLERLAEARSALIDSLASGDEAQVAPAVENFVPALLGALRLGINLVGRPKVVNFLAGYLAKLIGKWVGPALAPQLSNAIVDTGLRLITLEAEEEGGSAGAGAGAVALASVVEDTVRRLAESEEYIFENEDLAELAVAEAFGGAVATHFPPHLVRPDLRQSAAIGGTFVRRRPRTPRSFSKYSRVPEIELTAQIADSIPTFGGGTLGAALRGAGISLPMRARIHLYQASPGTTVGAIMRADRAVSGGAGAFHPLTPAAAGVLLREPKLGTRTPSSFLRSPHRLAAGQRIYALQPLNQTAPARGAGRGVTARLAPSGVKLAFDPVRQRASLALYLSEATAQEIAQAVRAGRGHGALLKAVVDLFRQADGSGRGTAPLREDREEHEEFALGGAAARVGRGALLRRLRHWVIPALAVWARQNAQAFARAAADPASGVTLRLQIGPVTAPGPSGGGKRPAGGIAPAVGITILSGRHRP